MTESEYITGSTTLEARYIRIDQIITALENLQITQIGNSGKQSYSLNNGQTNISVTYRSASDIAKAIKEYSQIKQQLYARIYGTNVVRLADAGSVQSNRRLR